MNKKIKIKGSLISILVAILMILAIPQISAIQKETNIDAETNAITTLSPDLVYYPMSHDFGSVTEGHLYQTTFDIWNGGSSTLTWTLGIIHTWVSPNPTSGSSTGEHDTVTVRIDTTGLSAGPYSGFVSISANDGGGVRYFNIDFIVVDNDSPNTPSQLNGPSSGSVGETLSYSTSTTDPNGDHIAYGLDINNDDNIDFWSSSYYPSGATYTVYITFSTPGTFPLRILAKDTYGAQSSFSIPKVVTISGTSNDPPNTPSKPSGSSAGNTGVDYSFSTSTTDPDGDQVKYGWDWNGDGTVDEWSGLKASGSSEARSHSWTIPGTYYIQVIAEDEYGAQSSFSLAKTITISSNQPPNKPSISGPSTGVKGSSYTYTSTTTDDDGDQIYYWFDWGDGSNSGWKGPYSSGQTASESHIWSAEGSYSIKVKTKDSNDAESIWSDPLSVSMPKGKTFNLFENFWEFLELFPRLSKIFIGLF
ncbi:hypothetical protein B6U98_04770 [Thermoplasmatales archaeon ex4572_165]|nr:MAG: hypothetical protein B6U98_04770 [Thermoplasmatales archaeon ex4572_165]